MKTTVTDILQKHHPIAINVISECSNCSAKFKAAIKEEGQGLDQSPRPDADDNTHNGNRGLLSK